MVSVLVVDDHPVVRRGLKALLESSDSGMDVDEAADGRQAVDAFRSRSFDLTLLDIDLPDQGGLDLLKRLQRIRQRSAVLMLSNFSERTFGLRCLRAGAMGYVSKSVDPVELIKATRLVLDGNRYLSIELAGHLVGNLSGAQASVEAYEALTDRELQVFRMLARGLGTSRIADELCLSVKTVHTHRARAMRKTGLKNNVEIARYSVEMGLVS